MASHIDLNSVTTDLRDPLFTWTGLLDKNGTARTAATVAAALLEINNDFTSHQNATADAHVAAAISIDVSNFESIPLTADTVQKFVDYIDDFDAITVREHRATQHANGIPLIARSQGLVLPDGYGWQNVVPATLVSTFLVRSPNTTPTDNISTGDDIVSFVPDNASFLFDSQFVRVKVGDIIRINYANGTEVSFPVESIRFIPGSEWIVRLNGVNLADTDLAFARIDRPRFDRETAGVLAVAAANATPTGSFDTTLQSVIVGHPHGASTVGIGFDPGQLDALHYKLYIEMYPTGDPSDRVISLPAIDVTGDAGINPGKYTFDSIIDATNKKLREIGYNYRLIAFAYNGDFGIMMADPINNASFAIISGNNSSGTLSEGIFTENVIGDAAGDGFDALGLGSNHSNIASPAFISSFTDSTAALIPTKVIVPRKSRYYMADGVKSDIFASTWQANSDGYWDGYISARNPIGAFTVETTYTVELDLRAAGLRPGKTLVIQPTVAFTDPLYNDIDYGRVIIKSISFAICPGDPSLTLITVINGIHGLGSGLSASGEPTLAVRVYFGEDSVSFNNQNVIDIASPPNYHRLHEIFISNAGNTFAHERARLPVQAQTTELLATENWHIEYVSPKLRGYRDDNITFNKYVRFYVLTYDTITGEYTGHIGQRDPSTSAITNVGTVETGRKDVPQRFYDETNIDYIDVVFTETATISPGNAILGTAVARYVDIELFDSLQLDDEMLLLATAEVNWSPQLSQDVIQRVKDRREFGSIDEEDFTNSAKHFISAGDRHLHENGVLRGLDFDFVNPTDNREIFYKGGVAIVNGTIVSVNNVSVTIPQVTEDPAGTGTVDWAICVNETGALIPIIVTTTKQEFFARDFLLPNSTYYVPSVTFSELVATRRDLTPIAVVTATIASVTIAAANITDVRRFNALGGLLHPLTLTADDFVGNFSSFDSVLYWVENHGAVNAANKVVIKGDIDISTSIDLTTLTKPVRFVGDGGSINVTTNRGFLLNSNVSFENLHFKYTPDLAYVTDDNINIQNGCMFRPGSTTGLALEDFNITKCTFTSDIVGQRPPFIAIQLGKEDVFSNSTITGCKFSDPLSDGYMAAIAIYADNGGALTHPAVAANVHIYKNSCDERQGIYVYGSMATIPIPDSPGLSAVNVNIEENNCGVIGYLISSARNVNASPFANRIGGLNIKNNNVNAIITINNLGRLLVTAEFTPTEGSGDVKIEGNCCNWIDITCNDFENQQGIVRINSNILRTFDTDYYMNTIGGTSSTPSAIKIINNTTLAGSGNHLPLSICDIKNNIIDGYGFNNVYLYGSGILVGGSNCSIIGNTINGFTVNGIIVLQNPFANDAATMKQPILISENSIFRENRDITSYVQGTIGPAVYPEIQGMIVDNFFDSPYVDAAETNTAVVLLIGGGVQGGSGWFASRNKNQTQFVRVKTGTLAMGSGIAPRAQQPGTPIASGWEPQVDIGNAFIIRYANADGSTNFRWVVDCQAAMPDRTYVVDASITHISDGVSPAATIDIDIHDFNLQTVNVADAITLVSTTTALTDTADPLIRTLLGPRYYVHDGTGTHIDILINANDSEDLNITIGDLVITYRW